MSLNNFCKDLFYKFCQQGINDRANFIKNITLTGFVLSSVAQSIGIVFNDKIPSKEKKFLLPQEIFDGAANALLFWFVTSKATDFGKKLVLTKKVLPKSLTKVMQNFIPDGKTVEQLKQSFMAHLKKSGTATDLKLADNVIEGMGVATGITGAILTNNIATPIIRNTLAGLYQKKQMGNKPCVDTVLKNDKPQVDKLEFYKENLKNPLLSQQINNINYNSGLKI